MFVFIGLAGCASPPLPPDPQSPASAQAHESKPQRLSSALVNDHVTNAVFMRLAATGGPAETPRASHGTQMQGMDHSGMPQVETRQPGIKADLEREIKKTSDEMKEVSDKMKKESEGAEAGKESSAVIYTCPMHPQIDEGKPGKCPICGMALIKKEPK
jgi:rubrerythrin